MELLLAWAAVTSLLDQMVGAILFTEYNKLARHRKRYGGRWLIITTVLQVYALL